MAKVKLKDVRLSFPDLFEAKEFEPGDGKPRYNASFLYDKDSANAKAIEAAMLEAAKEKFGAKAEAKLKAFKAGGDTCVSDGDTKEYEGYEGKLVIAAHRPAKNGPVGVYDRDLSPLGQNSGRPYAGCYVNATIDIWAQDGKYSGIRASLIGVQFVRDGDAFSGGKPASADDFESLDEGAEADLVG